MIDFYHSVQLLLSWGKTGQITQVLSPSSSIAQKTIFAHHNAEETCMLAMGAGAKTLHIGALPLVYSTAEYCAPVWCCSALTCLLDSVLNDALCIVTGCLCPTTMDHLPILSGIQPAELCRLGATLSLAYHGSLDPDHILYGLLNGSSDACQKRL